jgi:hypothetical protein
MKKLNIKLEEIAFAIVAGLSTIVSILDFSGGLDSIPWLSARIPTLTLLLLSVTSGYLVAEKRSQLKKLENLTQSGMTDIIEKISSSENNIASLINGGAVKVFKSPDEMYVYLIDRYQYVRQSIDLTYLGDNPHDDKNDDSLSSKFYNRLTEIIEGGRIRIRRVILVRNQNLLSWVEEMMSKFGNKPNVYLGCYPANSSTISYLISLMIIDDEEVLLTYSDKNLGFNRHTLSIKSPVIAEFCKNYFNVLWRESLIVQGKEVDYAAFDELKNRMMP